MKKKEAYIGLDVHKNSITIATLIGSNERAETAKIPNDIELLKSKLGQLNDKYELKSCYEATGNGSFIYRQLKNVNIACMVVAAHKVPSRNDRVKTDRRDAIHLARCLRSKILSPITIIDEEVEQVRDLVRIRERQVKRVTASKNEIYAFLFRKGIIFERKYWSQARLTYLKQLSLPERDRRNLDYLVDNYELEVRRLKELEADLESEAQSALFRDKVLILRAFRGIGIITAMTILTHMPDVRYFSNPKKLAAFVGIVPSEMSSGGKVRRGGITKAGSTLLRKAFIIIAHQYSVNRSPSAGLKARREAAPVYAVAAAQNAERNLRKKFKTMLLAGKHYNVAKVAIARKLVAYVWEGLMQYHEGELLAAN